MDSFVINGAQKVFSSRPQSAITKPVTFASKTAKKPSVNLHSRNVSPKRKSIQSLRRPLPSKLKVRIPSLADCADYFDSETTTPDSGFAQRRASDLGPGSDEYIKWKEEYRRNSSEDIEEDFTENYPPEENCISPSEPGKSRDKFLEDGERIETPQTMVQLDKSESSDTDSEEESTGSESESDSNDEEVEALENSPEDAIENGELKQEEGLDHDKDNSVQEDLPSPTSFKADNQEDYIIGMLSMDDQIDLEGSEILISGPPEIEDEPQTEPVPMEEVLKPRPESRAITSAASTCTLPSSCATPLPNPSGGIEDILNALERLEDEIGVDQNKSFQSRSSSVTSSNSSVKSGNGNHSKVSDLMSYLENVEKDQTPESCYSPLNFVKSSSSNLKVAELSSQSSTCLAEKIVSLQYTVEEKDRGISVLKQALDHQRRLSANFSKRFQKELQNRLNAQKGEYEAAITRHQNFIDQLIDDKKNLGEKCDALSLEMKDLERKYQDTLKNVELRHSAEVKRLKALQEASNKLKQEKWMDEKTKRIKEQTVRGLEPEVQRLMSRHANEIADIESDRDRRLAALERELHQRHTQQVRELRSQWEEEQQEAWQRERQGFHQRHVQQLDELKRLHKEEVDRLQEQLQRERTRCSEDRAHYEKEADQIRRIANERAHAEIERIKEEEVNKRKILSKKHANELASFRESETSERSTWERDCRQRLDDEWKAKEDGLRQQYKAERDAELDRAIEKLEGEVIRGRAEVEKEFQDRIKRIRVKYEAELEDCSKELDRLKDKNSKIRNELASKEEENIVLSAVIKQKEVLVEQLEQVNSRLELEREDVRQAVRGEFSSALEGLTNERAELLNQVSEVRLKLAEYQSEKEIIQKQYRTQAEEEAEKIHSKVKAAIQRKDETIAELRRSYDKAIEQCQHLEVLLERQTRDTYINPSQAGKGKCGRQQPQTTISNPKGI